MPLSALLRRYDHALIDLDGCLWVGDEPTPKAIEAIGALVVAVALGVLTLLGRRRQARARAQRAGP